MKRILIPALLAIWGGGGNPLRKSSSCSQPLFLFSAAGQRVSYVLDILIRYPSYICDYPEFIVPITRK